MVFKQSTYNNSTPSPEINLLFVCKRTDDGSEDHAGTKTSNKEDFNLVGRHSIVLVQGIHIGALQPISRWK